MYKLIILAVYDKFTDWPDAVTDINFEFEDSGHAELRALRWLTYRPNDIVMLIEEVMV